MELEENLFLENENLYKVKKIEEYARQNYIPVLLKDSANFLSNLVKKMKPERILEIGTAIGYSGSLMLMNFEGAHLTTIEKIESNYIISQNLFKQLGIENRITSVLCDALAFLSQNKEKFDFIFLDGPKGQYLYYLPFLIDALKEGGVLLADNVLFKGMIESSLEPPAKHRALVKKLREFNKQLLEDNRFESSLLKIGDGMIYAKKL